ncbi:MAG: radical SAM protein, partial [Acidobacteriota bacterium]
MVVDLARRLRARAQQEIRQVEPNPGGRLRVVLAYPNSYTVGMSNLGLHTVYRLLNGHPDVRCERAFLPDDDEIEEYLRRGTPLMTVESQQPVSDADVIAFSASFENDYVNVVRMLRLAGLPSRAAARDERHPLVLMGGATVSINPEPLAPFLDACCVGEGERLVGPLLDALLAHGEGGGHNDRAALLDALARLPGMYVPSLYEPVYEPDGDPYPAFKELVPLRGAPATIGKVRADFGGPESVAATAILTPDTEFGDRIMIEVARGCTKGCRYCWVGYNVLPFRVHAVNDVLAAAARWRSTTDRVGLVA